MLAINKLQCEDVYLLTMNSSEDIVTDSGATIKIRPTWQWLIE